MSMNKPGCLKKVPAEVYLKTEVKCSSNKVNQHNTPRPKKVSVAKFVPNPPEMAQKTNKQVSIMKRGISRHLEET